MSYDICPKCAKPVHQCECHSRAAFDLREPGDMAAKDEWLRQKGEPALAGYVNTDLSISIVIRGHHLRMTEGAAAILRDTLTDLLAKVAEIRGAK